MLIGCSTIPKPAPLIVDYPGNLTKDEARMALILTISNRELPKEWSNVEKIIDNSLSAGLPFYVSPRSRHRWTIESVGDDLIELGLKRRRHYLRCRVNYKNDSCNLSIIGSSNLRETVSRIHKSALVWFNNLEVIIRRSFGRVSMLKATK